MTKLGAYRRVRRRSTRSTMCKGIDLRIGVGACARPERNTIHRWRRLLKAPNKFEAALELAQERCAKVCEARQGRSGSFSWLGLLPMA